MAVLARSICVMIGRRTSWYPDAEDMIASLTVRKKKIIRLNLVLNEQTGLPKDVTNVKIVLYL